LDDLISGSIVYLPGPNGSVQVGSITLDKYGRPIKYRIRNPEYNSMWPAEDLPASALVHVYEKRRSLQARGEPWMAPIIERLMQDGDLVDTELQAAITASSLGIAITSEVHDTDDTTEDGTTDDPAQSLRLGGVARLYPGEDIKAFSHDRPSQQIAPFRQGIRGDIAAALRCPQRFLDRDVSKANYSSMRADMLDTDRLLSPVREWYGHATAGRLYREALPYLSVMAGIPMPKSRRYRLIPDGQPYVDPQKDVQAAISAITSGLSTWEVEIGKRGGDAKKLVEQLAAELNNPLLASIFKSQGGATENNQNPPDNADSEKADSAVK
jgi:lambda family phage portal protein